MLPVFQISSVTGYAANNSRALLRRRSSDALYVRMCFDAGTKCSESGAENPDFRFMDLVNKYREEKYVDALPRFVDIRQDHKKGRSPLDWEKYCTDDSLSKHIWNREDPKTMEVNEAGSIKGLGRLYDNEDYLPMNIGKKFDKLKYLRTETFPAEE